MTAPPHSNLDSADRHAQPWLKRKSHRPIDVPTDKNLGRAVLTRVPYNNLIRFGEAFSQILRPQAVRTGSIVSFGCGLHVLHDTQCDYLYCLLSEYR